MRKRSGEPRDTWVLDYMHARYFSPHLGRFMSVDPSAQSWDPKRPQSWNRYAYVRGNPLKYVDPDGQVLDTVLDVGFIGYDLFDIGRSLVKGEKVSGSQLLALSADVGAAFLPLVTGAGAAVRAGAHADDVVHGVELARRLGEAGEAAVRASFDIGEKVRIAVPGAQRFRIPDGVNAALKTLSEVKNVKKLSFTSQLRDFVKISKANDLKFVLYVRKDTKFSKPLMEAIERGDIELRFIPE